MKTTISPELFKELIIKHQVWSESYVGKTTPNGSQLILNDTLLAKCSILSANLTSCEMKRCCIEGVSFENCDFSASIFAANTFDECTFNVCKFKKATFYGCNFSSGTVFNACDFTKAELLDVNMSRTNLVNCSFAFTFFLRADLRYAVLDNADFTGAKISQAKLYNVNRYRLKSIEGAVADRVDYSPSGDGSKLVGGDVFGLLTEEED